MTLLVARRDFRESASDARLAIAMTTLTFIIPIVAAFAVGLAAGFLGGGARLIVQRLAEVGAFFVVFLPASFSLVLALESFSGERERNTLETLFATPLRESEIYLGKMGAVLLPSLGLSYSALVVYTGVSALTVHFVPTEELAPLVVVTMAQALVMVSGATIVSSQTKTLRSANVMASFIIIPMSAVIQGESVLIISHLAWVLWAVAALLLVVALLLLRLGILGFNRESILAKDSRPPDRKAVLNAVVRWRPRLRWRDIAEAFIRTRSAIAAAALLLVGGIMFGVLAEQFSLVPSHPVASLVQAEAAVVAPSGPPSQVAGTQLFTVIFSHNLVAVILMGLLAPFTLGALGGLFTLLNGFVVGYVGGLAAHSSLLGVFMCGVLPHRVVELPALVWPRPLPSASAPAWSIHGLRAGSSA